MATPDPAVVKAQKELEDLEKQQRALGNIYTFVRSTEITKAIGMFTFDHYIDEAKRVIKGVGRQVVDAAGQPVSTSPKISVRPSQLQYLDDIEKEFTDLYQTLKDLAAKADQEVK
jgi:hypothetical protein